MQLSKGLFTVTTWLGVLASAGCGTSDDSVYYTTSASDAWAVTASTDYYDSLMWYSTDPVDPFYYGFIVNAEPAADPSQIAAMVAAAAPNYFRPASCVTAVPQGATVTLMLSGCAGPLGMTTATGMVTITYASMPNALGLTIATQGLMVKGAQLSITSQGTVTAPNGIVTVQMMSSRSGVTLNGRSISQTGTFTLSWQRGQSCGTLNANFSDQTGALRYSTAIMGYMRCLGQCPQSGTVTRMSDTRSIVITMNGTSQPPWRTGTGQTGTVAIQCP
jgi:hypothetical protein